MPELRNRRHEQYAQLRAGGKSKTDAYAIGYGCRMPKRASEGGIRVEKRPEVDCRIRELQQEIAQLALKESREAAERQRVTREYVIAHLKANVERCMQEVEVLDRKGQPTGVFVYDAAGANRGLELLGKEIGMFRERLEIGRPGEFARLAALSDEQLDREEERLRQEEDTDRRAREQAAALINRASLPGDKRGDDRAGHG
jgi:phage terminase small subunit